ncbi:MAG: ribokinase [Aggregatilineales bacterium]
MSIVVFGSINIDLVSRTPHLPAPGETVQGHSFTTTPGGKGANQAVACARLGALTRMIGRVGDDTFRLLLIDNLRANGVDAIGVGRSARMSSGVAVIAVDDSAENNIIIVPGANGTIDQSDLARLNEALHGASTLMLQLEIGMEYVVAAAQLAQQHKVPVILDPAPAYPLPDELYRMVDILTPNETEATLLVGYPVTEPADIERAAQQLLAFGLRAVVIKLGSRGAYWSDGATSEFVPAFKVKAIDTVGAGDAFNGGLAVALSEGHDLSSAVRWAAAAGALATTKRGAQESMPMRRELEQLLGTSATYESVPVG